jgi:hypothetical protein
VQQVLSECNRSPLERIASEVAPRSCCARVHAIAAGMWQPEYDEGITMETFDAPKIPNIPIGIAASGARQETDSMGAIEVPARQVSGRSNAAIADPLLHRHRLDAQSPTAVPGRYLG